jgi:hypothetical protein
MIDMIVGIPIGSNCAPLFDDSKKVEFVEDYSLFVVQKENHTEISKNWRSVLVVDEAVVPGENHIPWASNWITCGCESSASFL